VAEVIEKKAGSEQKEKGSPAVVIDVRLKTSKKVYTFEIDDDLELGPGTTVVAESEMGICIGHVIGSKYRMDRPEQPLRRIMRIATEEDIRADAENKLLEEEAKAFCLERVKARNLPMKIVATESTLDRKRLIFYFTADGRIDFRELVRDLAARFKTRIEMRQIGVRDEAKIIGGIGMCGRATCCSSFLTNFEPISIRMVKQQELALSQNKLSGICGRLMCCIAYEYEGPEDQAQRPCRHRVNDQGLVEEYLEDMVPSQSDSAPEVSPPVIQPDREETGAEKKGKKHGKGSRKRHSKRKAEKKEKKGKPFSKRKKFMEKKRQ